MLKVGFLTWGTRIPNLVEAQKKLDFLDLYVCSMKDLEKEEKKQAFLAYLQKEAEIILLHPQDNEYWQELVPFIEELKREKKILCWGKEASFFLLSSVVSQHVTMLQTYMQMEGLENMVNLFCYLAKEVAGLEVEYEEPKELLWQGIYAGGEKSFAKLEDYLAWAAEEGRWSEDRPKVGLLFNRQLWINRNTEVIDSLIQVLGEKGVDVLATFTQGHNKVTPNVWTNEEIVNAYFFQEAQPIISLFLNMQAHRFVEETENWVFLFYKAFYLITLTGRIGRKTLMVWAVPLFGM